MLHIDLRRLQCYISQAVTMLYISRGQNNARLTRLQCSTVTILHVYRVTELARMTTGERIMLQLRFQDSGYAVNAEVGAKCFYLKRTLE